MRNTEATRTLAETELGKLFSLIPKQSVTCGTEVQLNTAMDYLACNVVIADSTRLPSDSEVLCGVKGSLENRVYHLPSYLFLGTTQCGVVELTRGMLSTGKVRVLCKYCDLIDAKVDETNRRRIVLMVSVDVWCNLDSEYKRVRFVHSPDCYVGRRKDADRQELPVSMLSVSPFPVFAERS